jgi:hypothetical protein
VLHSLVLIVDDHARSNLFARGQEGDKLSDILF